jgi:hypothetical protein
MLHIYSCLRNEVEYTRLRRQSFACSRQKNMIYARALALDGQQQQQRGEAAAAE